jgi:hypothetical protein
MPDALANFAYSTVLTAPSPAASGTSVVLQSGNGARFPVAPFDVLFWPVGVQPLATNAEIARCTVKSTDTLTITRAQYGTSARTVVVGDQVCQPIDGYLFSQYLAVSNYLSEFSGNGDAARFNLGDQVLGSNQCVATTNLTLSGLQTIDGYTLLAGDRILLTGQTTASQNGPWYAASGAWSRTIEFPSGGSIGSRLVYVVGGTLNANTLWAMTNLTDVTIDTTAITWVKTSAPLASPIFTGIVTAPALSVSGLTGATTATRYVGGTTGGPPTTGTFIAGDYVIDTQGNIWVCSVGGTSGTWVAITAVGIGTPATATQQAAAMTAGSANIVSGSLVRLNTGEIGVSTRFRWEIGVAKTLAGVATWKADVKFGTAGTTSDATIATFTSGTNTASADQATLVIIMNVLTIGASATAGCLAFYQNELSSSTGLGSFPGVPGSTASFNSAAAQPYLHIDITPGTSAVMNAWCSAERLS